MRWRWVRVCASTTSATTAPTSSIRSLTCTEGIVQVDIEYAPRPEYGLIFPILTAADGVISARGGADVLTLESPLPLELRDSVARGRISMQAGESVAFALHDRRSWETPSTSWGQEGIARRLDDTIAGWQSWSDLHQAYEGPWRDLVHQSGRVLQALQYPPTGAIVAAPTTSLPEEVGGERNWDYRYAWVRDASLTLEALWVSACPDEASDFFSYLAGAASTQLAARRRSADHVRHRRASTTSPSAPCRICPAGAAAVPFASGTERGTSVSSTSTARC